MIEIVVFSLDQWYPNLYLVVLCAIACPVDETVSKDMWLPCYDLSLFPEFGHGSHACGSRKTDNEVQYERSLASKTCRKRNLLIKAVHKKDCIVTSGGVVCMVCINATCMYISKCYILYCH